jgi:hypothetical protein
MRMEPIAKHELRPSCHRQSQAPDASCRRISYRDLLLRIDARNAYQYNVGQSILLCNGTSRDVYSCSERTATDFNLVRMFRNEDMC